MKRVVIFASYEKDGLILDYVIYYLKELKKVSDEIIFVSCKNISEKYKLDGIVSHIIDENHDEYDFGSYKRGFLYLQDRLNEFDEIVFANDSCYGPLYSMEDVFSTMENKECDFWGITKNNFGYPKTAEDYFIKRPHIQSYFIVFKKQIFNQNFFIDFIKSIKHEDDKKMIISKYEIGLTELLVNNGFRYETLVNGYEHINNVAIFKWREIIKKCHMPFLKKSLLTFNNITMNTIEDYEKYLGDYPSEFIELPRKINKKTPKWFKILFFNLLAEIPYNTREKIIKIFNKTFKSLFRLVQD